MEMGAQNPIDKIKQQGEIYICPICNYVDGFYVSFKIFEDVKNPRKFS